MKLFYYNHNNGGLANALSKQTTSFYDLTLVINGTMRYLIDNKTVELYPGDAVFIKKESTRTREPSDMVEYVSYNFLEEDFNSFPLIMRGVLGQRLEAIINAFETVKNTTNDLSDTRLTFLFSALLAELRFQIEQEKETDVVRLIKKYVHEHLTEKISLSTLSKAVFFSVPYIEKTFKAETGASIMHYVIKERLSLAKNLLLDNTSALKDVAQKCGFADYNFFCRTFTKHVGCTPSAYRNAYRPTVK